MRRAARAVLSVPCTTKRCAGQRDQAVAHAKVTVLHDHERVVRAKRRVRRLDRSNHAVLHGQDAEFRLARRDRADHGRKIAHSQASRGGMEFARGKLAVCSGDTLVCNPHRFHFPVGRTPQKRPPRIRGGRGITGAVCVSAHAPVPGLLGEEGPIGKGEGEHGGAHGERTIPAPGRPGQCLRRTTASPGPATARCGFRPACAWWRPT